MNDAMGFPAPVLVSEDARSTWEDEFEERLADSGVLAFRVAYGVLRRREDAEDVAQEALARAFRNRGRLRDRAAFRAWLVRITWRLALDHRRADQRRERREQAAARPVPVADAEDLAAATEERTRLWQAIDALPEKLRLVLVLGALQEHDVREVAALLGLPEGTVKSRLHLARRRLAEALR